MAKKKIKCQTCGEDLTGKNYANMYDDKTGQIVPVCNYRPCQRPYSKNSIKGAAS